MGRTLITGASGFVGAHLLSTMESRGLPKVGVSRQRNSGLITVPSYESTSTWRALLQDVNAIIHLAARVHVMHETAPDALSEFRQANVASTLNLARQAAAAGVRRFVFVSSIKVNGERTEAGKPFTARDLRHPQDPYGISKAEAEVQLLALGLQLGLEITIVRPPLVYGAGVRGNFRRMMNWAARGLPSIFPMVRNKRSLIHVSNLCDLLIETLYHPDAVNRVFLASDGHDLSTHELLTALTIAAGRQPRSIPVPTFALQRAARIAGWEQGMARLTENLQVDITDTCNTLNWRPMVSPHDKTVWASLFDEQ